MNPADEALAKLHAHEKECQQFREHVKYRFQEQKTDTDELKLVFKQTVVQCLTLFIAFLGYLEFFR